MCKYHSNKYNYLLIDTYIFLSVLLCISFSFAGQSSDIFQAAIKGNVIEIQGFLDRGVDINAIDENGVPPLIYAAMEGNTLVVETLLNRGANPSIRDKNGKSAIDWLVQRGGNRSSIETTAIQQIQEDIIRLHVELEKNEKVLAVYFDAFKLILTSLGIILTILGYIGFKSLKKFTIDYIKNKIDVNTNDESLKKRIEEKIRDGVFVIRARSDIFYFIQEGKSSEIQKSLKDVDINIRSSDGRTLLMEASIFGRADIVKILLNKNAKINAASKRSGKTAVIYAIENDHKDILRLLLRKGADVNIEAKHNRTALRTAVDKNSLEMTKIVLAQGNDIDVDAADKTGWTALAKAAEEGFTDIAKLLIEKGANINQKDFYGWTPLMKSATKGHSGMIKLLIDKGAMVNETDLKGRDALAKAKEKNHMDVVEILIKAGAHSNNKTKIAD